MWDYCKIVISNIKTYGKVLLDAKFQGARHVYGSSEGIRYDGTTEFLEQFGCITSATATGKGFVITHLTKGAYNYMAIVSHDWENGQVIYLSISEHCNWELIQDDDAWRIINGTSVRVPLKPGGIILIKYRLGIAGPSQEI